MLAPGRSTARFQPAGNTGHQQRDLPYAFQTPARYGSGAASVPLTAPSLTAFQRARIRSHSRDRDRNNRDRRRRSPGGREFPSGPQEASDWAAALANVENSIETLRRQQTNQA